MYIKNIPVFLTHARTIAQLDKKIYTTFLLYTFKIQKKRRKKDFNAKQDALYCSFYAFL
jgi:hypothetical protein